MDVRKFICENTECKHEEEKNIETEKGILIGCNCSKCGWHMMREDLL